MISIVKSKSKFPKSKSIFSQSKYNQFSWGSCGIIFVKIKIIFLTIKIIFPQSKYNQFSGEAPSKSFSSEIKIAPQGMRNSPAGPEKFNKKPRRARGKCPKGPQNWEMPVLQARILGNSQGLWRENEENGPKGPEN